MSLVYEIMRAKYPQSEAVALLKAKIADQVNFTEKPPKVDMECEPSPEGEEQEEDEK